MKNYLLGLITLVIGLSACEKTKQETAPDVKVTAFQIKGIARFECTDDSVHLLIRRNEQMNLIPLTDITSDAFRPYFQRNDTGEFVFRSRSINISKDDYLIRTAIGINEQHFLASRALNIDTGKTNFLDNLTTYPNPNQGSATLQLNNKSRGVLYLEIFNLRGESIAMDTTIKTTDSLSHLINMPQSAAAGVYVMRALMGGTTKAMNLIVTK